MSRPLLDRAQIVGRRPVPSGTGEPGVWSIITSLTTGGAESLVVSLNAAFAAAGVRHTVVSLCDAQYLGNSAETQARLASRIAASGGRFVSLGLNGVRNPLTGAIRLRRLLARDRPQVIHAHTARAIPIIALSGYSGQVAMTHHNSRLTFPRQTFRLLDRVVDRYVAISPETEDIYRTDSRKPAIRIANGSASEFLAAAARTAMRSPPRIVSVGAISDQKNYDLLIEAASCLQRMVDPPSMPHFSIAGGGARLSEYREKVRARRLESAVAFLGERSDVSALLTDADLFLNTSLYEGQSVAILEAFAAALPVIATDVRGNCDLVREGINGTLAPPEAPESLAEAVVRLAEDPERYRRLSAGALATGRRHSIGATAERHLELYREMVSNSSAMALTG